MRDFAVQDTQPLPHNIEAEQQLLGAILANNERFDSVAPMLSAEDFYEPFHGRLWDAMRAAIEDGELADVITMKGRLSADPAMQKGELEPRYLVKLLGGSISGGTVRDYAKMVKEAAHRRETLALLDTARERLMGGAEKPGDTIASLEAALVSLAPSESRMRSTSILAATTAAISEINDTYQGKETPAVPVPWDALWGIVPAFRGGNMVVLGGRPAMGKSAVALSLATAAAWAGHPVIIASFEMSPEDVAMRALSEQTSRAGNAVPYRDMIAKDFREDQFRTTVDAAKAIQALPIHFLTEDFRKPGALLAGVRQALRGPFREMRKTPLIVVDYMQLMKGQGNGLFEQATDISMAMKHLAMSTGSAVLALSQLSRNVEQRDNKRPVLSDLRQTGQIEQDADAIIFCYRDEYYLERERPHLSDADAYADWEAEMSRAKNCLELIVAKQRRGPIGTAHLKCALEFNRVWG